MAMICSVILSMMATVSVPKSLLLCAKPNLTGGSIVKRSRCLWFICLLACPPVLVSAGDPQPSESPIQPNTFTLSILRAFDHSGAPVVQTVRPDGSLMADHRGSLGHVTMARFAADGTIETFCTSHESEARHWMIGKARPRSVTPQTVVEVKN